MKPIIFKKSRHDFDQRDFTRRDFIRQVLSSSALAGLAGPFFLSASGCSTLDEYLIEDQFDLDQELVIIGAGVAGLYAAYECRRRKIPFKIFDAQSRFGGKILTLDQTEWGASVFEKADSKLIQLCQEFSIDRKNIDSKHWVPASGMQTLIDNLVDSAKGLIPSRQIRSEHRFVSLRQFGQRYQIVFKNKEKDRIYFAKKVLFALPLQSYKSIKSLADVNGIKDLQDYLQSTAPLSKLRIVLTADDIRDEFKVNKLGLSKKYQIQVKKLNHEIQTRILSNYPQIHYYSYDNKYYFTITAETTSHLRQTESLRQVLEPILNSHVVLNDAHVMDWTNFRSGEGLDYSRINLASVLNDFKSWPNQLRFVSEAQTSIYDKNKSTVENILLQVNRALIDFV